MSNRRILRGESLAPSLGNRELALLAWHLRHEKHIVELISHCDQLAVRADLIPEVELQA
jgi:hypothetical protein